MATATTTPAKKRVGPNVAWQRPEFLDLLPRWNLIRDCIAGSPVIKKKGDVYLPRPNATDKSPENLARFEAYVQRAVFYGVTQRTRNGLVGQVMSEDPVLDLPDIIGGMEKDVDGGGVTLIQQLTKALELDVAYGRGGLLVDYPKTAGTATTKKELDDEEVRPTITLVEPWDIINWRVEQVGGKARLTGLVISEQYVTDDDGFEQCWDPQWRRLYLDDEGLCVIEEWIIDPNNKDEFIIKPIAADPEQAGGKATTAVYQPTDSKGARLDYIPFHFFGSTNNDPTPDLPPLYDLADLNIAHYRNSADHEEATFICGQPTPVLAGVTEDWVRDVFKGQVQLGSRVAIPLPPQATASMLQATENTLPGQGMKDKEAQMRSLGAKLLQENGTEMTATQVNSDRAAETSTLGMIANNVSSAYECALRMALRYVDAPAAEDDEAVEVELNTSFIASKMSPEERGQLLSEWQAGMISDEEMRKNLTRGGVATEDFETWKTASEEQALTKPIMGGLPGAPGQTPQEKAAADADAKAKAAAAKGPAKPSVPPAKA